MKLELLFRLTSTNSTDQQTSWRNLLSRVYTAETNSCLNYRFDFHRFVYETSEKCDKSSISKSKAKADIFKCVCPAVQNQPTSQN